MSKKTVITETTASGKRTEIQCPYLPARLPLTIIYLSRKACKNQCVDNSKTSLCLENTGFLEVTTTGPLLHGVTKKVNKIKVWEIYLAYLSLTLKGKSKFKRGSEMEKIKKN